MKIINAIWEKRNIGVLCNEIIIETQDNISMIKNEINKIETEYTVIKVPAGMIDISFYLQNNGYKYFELITTCHRDVKTPVYFNSVQERILKSLSCELMDDNDLEQLYLIIKSGLFTDDRISLDPFFTIEQANNRYINWIKDELINNALIYKIINKDKMVGFFGFKKKNDITYYNFLGGIFPEYQKFGYGLAMLYLPIEEVKKLGAKRIEMSYSSNNRGATALHLLIGYVLNTQYNVFIKHQKK